ncbi:MAG: cupin domain-containing protein [Spirulina sp.]
MNLEQDIVTVRPAETVDTIQKLPNYVGISEQTAGAKGISMNIVVIPPGAKAEPHFHDGFETAIYLIQGNVQTFYGENLAKSVTNQQGDFIFIPEGVPHQPVNLSNTEAAIALVARNDPNEQESVQVYRGHDPAVPSQSADSLSTPA